MGGGVSPHGFYTLGSIAFLQSFRFCYLATPMHVVLVDVLLCVCVLASGLPKWLRKCVGALR